MKIKDMMKDRVIRIGPEETVAVAARTLAQYNIGVLPVCRQNGKLCGVVTDRDLVTRCLAANRNPEETKVSSVMTGQVISIEPETELSSAATLMEVKQVKRLPVVEQGKLRGIVSLSDLAARPESKMETQDLVSGIWANVTEGELIQNPGQKAGKTPESKPKETK